ncbi:helix-turn-helix transcriptional regulator [Siccirubricoccus deserti]|uniref:Helix-turn-helix domain-containing protein n=1 Tax=Siccirubricoccus deserti TaxID=2013562 RepID=A0A9X0UGU2_9PROT|nr:helix-turn-helix domain-containing protein [Siccirubricoccus deserti]MBC4019391.1 helix-turn-helix domain-containing protein [Siccirubricoccus deserti]
MDQPKLILRRSLAPVTPAAAPAPRPPQSLLTPEDVAVRLGVSRKALERWRGTGDGPRFVRLGHKTIRYRVEDVDAFVAERLCVSTAA